MTPIFETERLRFRLMRPEDEADLERLDGDPKVRAFFPGGVVNRPTSRDRVESNLASYRQHGFCDFAVVERSTGAFAGRCGLHLLDDGEVEVGYLFLPERWGQGYATEALRGVLQWARSLPPERIPNRRIIAFATVDHAASLRVMEKAGMRWLKSGRFQELDTVFYEASLGDAPPAAAAS